MKSGVDVVVHLQWFLCALATVCVIEKQAPSCDTALLAPRA
jgi:hypothetical protein